MNRRKALSLVSSVIFIAITISAIAIVYEAGMPIVKKMQASASIEKMKDVFTDLDKVIRDVASEGTGSKRTVYLRVDPGTITVNDTEDAIYWELETDAKVIEPRTRQMFGNIAIGSNMETSAYEQNYSVTSPQIQAYKMENEHLVVYVRKVGSGSSYADFTTNNLLLGIYNKDLGAWFNNTNMFDVTIDSQATSRTANGTTSLLETGYNLPYATVSALVNSTYLMYYVNFTLESGEDFMKIEAGAA
jgi:hypothetical protein